MRHINIKKIEKNIAVMIVLSGFLLFAVSMNVTANDISVDNVIKDLNEARIFSGLSPLVKNNALAEAAQAKLQDMLENNYFEHTSPSGVDPWHWISKNGYDYTFAGENLAMDFRTAEAQQAAWMQSPTHKKNILNANFQEVGVAVKQGMINGHMTTITVQEFGARKDFFAASPKENEVTKNIREIAVSGEKILGVQNANLSSLNSKFNAIFTEGINNTFAVGAISGWTLILFGIAMSAMGVSAVYLAFDIYKIRKETKMAGQLHHQNVYHIGEDEYTQILEHFSTRPVRFRNHHS